MRKRLRKKYHIKEWDKPGFEFKVQLSRPFVDQDLDDLIDFVEAWAYGIGGGISSKDETILQFYTTAFHRYDPGNIFAYWYAMDSYFRKRYHDCLVWCGTLMPEYAIAYTSSNGRFELPRNCSSANWCKPYPTNIHPRGYSLNK